MKKYVVPENRTQNKDTISTATKRMVNATAKRIIINQLMKQTVFHVTAMQSDHLVDHVINLAVSVNVEKV